MTSEAGKRGLSNRFWIAAVAALFLLIAISIVVVRLNLKIAGEREAIAEAARIDVEIRPLRAPARDGLTAYLNTADARAVAVFDGLRYLATSGGLVRLDAAGNPSTRFTTLDGLPDNDLTSLAVFRGRLFAGTSSAGLISFDGTSFTSYRFLKPKAVRISVLLPTDSELLVGTMDGGLFEFDGERFSRRYNSTPGADFNRVTALLDLESRLYVGTQDQGLFVWQEARIERLSVGEGLPSPRVTGLARLPDRYSEFGLIGVATDFGTVALGEQGSIQPLNARPNVTSLAVHDRRLFAGQFGGGVVELVPDAPATVPASQRPAGPSDSGLPRATPVTIAEHDDELWAFTPAGAFSLNERGSALSFDPVSPQLAAESILSAEHVTGLAVDGRGRLWIGYFDRGIDLVDAGSGERLSHVEDDRVREINFLIYDRDQDRTLAATSMGLAIVDARFRQTVLTREQSGLVHNSVAHVLLASRRAPHSLTNRIGPGSGTSMYLITAGGLTEYDGGRARSLTAFHGLASNHLYASAFRGSQLFVGSLAGLVELEGLRVVRTYKTSNSRLSHDWVTALAAVNGVLFVGTNGGGVDQLLPTGEWVNLSDELGRFEVNPNAMHFDGDRLYVGTSDRGLLVYNTRDRRWTRISSGLTAQNVTAIITDERFVYAGTVNGLVRIEKRVIE